MKPSRGREDGEARNPQIPSRVRNSRVSVSLGNNVIGWVGTFAPLVKDKIMARRNGTGTSKGDILCLEKKRTNQFR